MLKEPLVGTVPSVSRTGSGFLKGFSICTDRSAVIPPSLPHSCLPPLLLFSSRRPRYVVLSHMSASLSVHNISLAIFTSESTIPPPSPTPYFLLLAHTSILRPSRSLPSPIQTRSLANHVEFESREWMQAFNLSLGLSSVFEYLSEWFESPNSKDNHVVNGCEDITATPITPPKIGQPPIVLCTVHGMVSGILQKLSTWQEWFVEHSDRIHIKLYPRDDGEPNDTKNTLALCQSPPMISFHLLLHRFYSSCLRECCKLAHLTSTLARLQSDLSMDRGQVKASTTRNRSFFST